MATSRGKDNPDISGKESGDDTLNIASPGFDPYKALYANTLQLPTPDAKQFNNLAEFENFLKGKDAATQKKNNPPKKVLPGIIAERAAAQAKEAVRKAAILQKNKGPAERTETQQRKMRLTNVFTRMQNYETGPMSLLRRSVNEKLKVLVVVRAAVAVRSHCKGFVVAFDKHMNMALLDVDETFIRPQIQKPDIKSDEKKQNKKKTKSTQRGDQSSVNQECKDPVTTSDVSTAKGRSQTVGLCSSKVTNSTNIKKEESSCISDERVSQSLKPESGTSSTGLSAKTSFSIPKFRIPKKSHKQSDSETFKSKRSSTTCDESTFGKSCSDSEIVSVVKQIKKERQECVTDVDEYQKSKQEPSCVKQGKCVPFWPTYKLWAESRCYCKYDIVHRSVNQLFIRGDNVVSVSLVS